MNYEIHLLSITQADWLTFIKVCQDVLGYSPSRGLDACKLDPANPASYLASLNMKNTPLESLREDRQILEHFMASFLCILDDEVIKAIATHTRLRMIEKVARKESAVILSGTMAEWLDAVIAGSKEDTDFDFRWVMNAIMVHLERAGFKEILHNWDKHFLQDKTFKLRHSGRN